ncbi:MAG: hypothetical protein WCX79_02720 [Candidatus Paceibacterota bacterium]|jgi:pentose-5-phosphate-3-epimerase
MAEIVPAVMPKNYEDLKNKIALVRGFSPLVQIDICDGVLVKNKTWPFTSSIDTDLHFQKILNEEEGLPFWEDIDFELDLMVMNGVENFDIYTKLGPKRMVFHLSPINPVSDFRDFLEGIDPYIKDSIEIGVGIWLDKPVEDVFPLVNCIDFVQIMGIKRIGFQGEEFDNKCIEYVKILRKKFPNLIISIDGGVNFDTAPLLINNGVDRLAIGSALFNTDDIIGTLERFKNL